MIFRRETARLFPKTPGVYEKGGKVGEFPNILKYWRTVNSNRTKKNGPEDKSKSKR